MSVPAPTPQEMMAAQAAAAAAARQFNIEAFTLLGVGLTVTILRTYVRVSSVGVKRLQVDDYLVWFAAVRTLPAGLHRINLSNRCIPDMLLRRDCFGILCRQCSTWSCQQWHDTGRACQPQSRQPGMGIEVSVHSISHATIVD